MTYFWHLRMLLAVTFAAMFFGCSPNGVGDPCIPETVPPTGFVDREVYVETSAAQCRTRVCMVYRLGRGDPNQGVDPEAVYENDPGGCNGRTSSPYCSRQRGTCSGVDCETDSLDRVFCTRRCTTASECGDGYHCEGVVSSGEAGIVGSYCVPNVVNPNWCDTTHPCAGGEACRNNQCGG